MSRITEEDIRTKVLAVWLKDLGFDDVQFEYSFSLTIGRSVHEISSEHLDRQTKNPRADILVKSNGRNLLVVEVKAPDQKIDEASIDQGISYARLLPQIAPFVVITNGLDTRVFDAITCESIDGESIPSDHKHVRSGFRVCSDDIQFRAEAAELFLGLSHENLLQFCRNQYEYRVARLKGLALDSGKKYIPKLFVHRSQAEGRLNQLIDSGCDAIAIVGRPQVGKTNFVCNFIEQQLEKGVPCFFFPAASLHNGLLAEIREDFGWILNDVSSIQVVIRKLNRILRNTDLRGLVFVDGWNELAQEHVALLDDSFNRLAASGFQVLVSFTNSASTRLLTNRGEPGFIAEATSIGIDGAELLSSDPESILKQRHWSAVFVSAFDKDETIIAYETYGNAFGATFDNNHIKTSDPYLLGVAMRHFQGGMLPPTFDEPELIGSWLNQRIARISSHSLDVPAIVDKLGEGMTSSPPPICEQKLKSIVGIPAAQVVPCDLYDNAILIIAGYELGRPQVDFYHSRDRDFVIAYRVLKLNETVNSAEELSREFQRFNLNEATLGAVSWFLQHSKHLKTILDASTRFPEFENSTLTRMFLRGCCACVLRHQLDLGGHFDDLMDIVKTSTDGLVRIESMRLMSMLVDEYEVQESLLPLLKDAEQVESFLLSLVEIQGEFAIRSDALGGVVLRIIESIQNEECVGVHSGALVDESTISKFLRDLLENPHDIRRLEFAITVMGKTNPTDALEWIKRNRWTRPEINFRDAVKNAVSTIDEYYFGSPYCPNLMSILADDRQDALNEYTNLMENYGEYVDLFTLVGVYDRFKGIRDTLVDIIGVENLVEHVRPKDYREPDDPRQTYMAFLKER